MYIQFYIYQGTATLRKKKTDTPFILNELLINLPSPRQYWTFYHLNISILNADDVTQKQRNPPPTQTPPPPPPTHGLKIE